MVGPTCISKFICDVLYFRTCRKILENNLSNFFSYIYIKVFVIKVIVLLHCTLIVFCTQWKVQRENEQTWLEKRRRRLFYCIGLLQVGNNNNLPMSLIKSMWERIWRGIHFLKFLKNLWRLCNQVMIWKKSRGPKKPCT